MTAQHIYREAWRASPLAIVTLDETARIDSCNPASERLFARDQGDMQGRALETLAHPVDRGALRSMIAEALVGEVPPRQEIRFHQPGAKVIVTGFSVAPTREGSPGGVCVLRDLSREQALRPQLLHTERMASIGVVASVVAHELNNALAGALGCLQLMPPPTDPNAAELLESMAGELRRSAEIVRELKGYARVDEGASDRVLVPDLLHRLERLRRYHAGAKPTTLVLDLDDPLPVIEGNANQLLQALLNLVRNAEQAVAGLPDERRVITISARVHDDVVVLAVSDRGPGVPPRLRSRLFEPFYSTKPAGDGTGLGLTVVQAVAAGHGGRIEIDQAPGGGAVFRMVLPRPSAAPEPAERPRVDRSTDYAALRGVRILVADDEPLIRRVVERACTTRGSEVICAEDAEDALQVIDARAHQLDLVLLDVRMPRGGGPRVFRSIRAHHPHLVPRTIFMSGELSADMSETVGQGHAGVLPKPFDLHELFAMFDAALGRVAAPTEPSSVGH